MRPLVRGSGKVIFQKIGQYVLCRYFHEDQQLSILGSVQTAGRTPAGRPDQNRHSMDAAGRSEPGSERALPVLHDALQDRRRKKHHAERQKVNASHGSGCRFHLRGIPPERIQNRFPAGRSGQDFYHYCGKT